MDGNAEANAILPKLKGKVTTIPETDKTLTKEGFSADAKVTGEELTKRVQKSDIVNNLTTEDAEKPLSASMGKQLKKQIDDVDPHFAENVQYDNTTSKLAASDVQSAIDELSNDISIDNLGSFNGKTITQLQTAISDWLSNKARKSAQCTFIANADFITLWNNNDTTTTLTAGNIYTLTVIGSYTDSNYVQLALATYYDKKLYTVVKSGGTWQKFRKIAYSEETATMLLNEQISPSENLQTVTIPNYNNYDALYITIKPDENSGVTLNIPKVMYGAISSTFNINCNNKDGTSYTARVQGYVKNGVINLYHSKLVGWTKLNVTVYGIN